MSPYWSTSHSIAVLVQQPVDTPAGLAMVRSKDWGATLNCTPVKGEPWWFFTGEPHNTTGPSHREVWSDMLTSFSYVMSLHDRRKAINGMAAFEADNFGVPDPKVQTIHIKDVAFRAIPKSRCSNTSKPPAGSFMPQVLPPIPAGYCVLELAGLEPRKKYRLSLYSIADGTHPPAQPPSSPSVEASLRTTPAAPQVEATRVTMKVLSALSVLVGLAWQIKEHAALATSSSYARLPLQRLQTVGGFNQVIVQRQSLDILKDVMRSLTLFLPLVGPLGFVLASDVLIGVRLKKTITVYHSWSACTDPAAKRLFLLEMVKNVFMLVVNTLMIPVNLFAVQMIWLTYASRWLDFIGLSASAQTSYSSFQRQYRAWQYITGLEFIGWVPGIILSVLMLAMERHSERVLSKLSLHKQHIEEMLGKTPKGGALYQNLSTMENSPFISFDQPVALWKQAICMALAALFGLLPHLWMCVRHGVRLWNGPLMWVTIVYMVNVSGVCSRFLVQAQTIVTSYKNHCRELSVFQALSWREDPSMALYDPFVAQNERVVRARDDLRDSPSKITPLKLEDPVESKVWWYLREMLLINLRASGSRMETMVLVYILMSLLAGLASVEVMIVVMQISSTTLVSAIVVCTTMHFTYKTLKYSRDINLMCGEHISLLHMVVAEANMPLRPQRPLDSHLQQERFLLQLATLIERQPPPVTIASFTVTPQLFSALIGIQGFLFAVASVNLVRGLVRLITAGGA